MKGKQSAAGLIVDGLVWAVAVLILYLNVTQQKDYSGDALGKLAGALMFSLFLSAGTAIWIPLRMSGRMRQLSNRAHREELATTQIQEGRYLAKNLAGLALRAAGPSILMAFSVGWSFAKYERSISQATSTAILYSSPLWCVAALAVLGCLDWMGRLCRDPRAGGKWFVSFMWLVAAPALPLALMIVAALVNGGNSKYALASTLFGLAASIVFIAVWWKDLVGSYFRFEEPARANPIKRGESQ